MIKGYMGQTELSGHKEDPYEQMKKEASCAKARDVSEIEREMANLDNQVARAVGRLGILENRISSVMAPEPTTGNAASSPAPAIHSPLGNQLAEVSQRVGYLNEMIESMMDRIKL